MAKNQWRDYGMKALALLGFWGWGDGVFLGKSEVAWAQIKIPTQEEQCGPGVWGQMRSPRHGAGESWAMIAQEYGLHPQTLRSFNPQWPGEGPSVAAPIAVPPVDGMAVAVVPGTTWQDLGKTYGVDGGVLFELNGCLPLGEVVFIPQNWFTPMATEPANGDRSPQRFSQWPLGSLPEIGLGFGSAPASGDFFHSGLDLMASLGAEVVAVARGTVVFAGTDGDYGQLVVIDHGQGLQTRYGHLSQVQTMVGATITPGDILGTVGTTGNPDLSQPHLHFEVRRGAPLGWLAQDPLRFLPSPD